MRLPLSELCTELRPVPCVSTCPAIAACVRMCMPGTFTWVYVRNWCVCVCVVFTCVCVCACMFVHVSLCAPQILNSLG